MSAASPFQMPFTPFDTEAMSKFFPMNDTMNGFARSAVSATTESTRASMQGMQDVSNTLLAQMKEQMTLGVETSKKLAETTTLEDAMTLQASYMKSSFEAGLKSFSELSELYADTMREAFAPLAKQAKKTAKAAKI
ncbi:MAG: phasin family protein [Pseudomonadota bacterium]